MLSKWTFLSRKILLNHPRIDLVEDTVQLPNGKTTEYIRLLPATSHSVAIIAVNSDNKILVQREYSYPPNEILYQFPGGGAEIGEDIIDAANRELSEESGYIARDCSVIGSFYLDNRRSDKKQFVVLCRDLVEQKRPGDDEEFIESQWLSHEDIKALVRERKIENVNMLASLHLLESSSRQTH